VLAITWADPLALGASDVEHAKHIAGKFGFGHWVAILSPEALFELPEARQLLITALAV